MNSGGKIKIIFSIILFTSITFLFPFNIFAEKNPETSKFKAGFYYTVKKGDTLWDLSEQFSDSPWVWPELWGENEQLLNPHWIYPGEKIRIFHMDWLDKKKITQKTIVEPAFYAYPQIEQVGFIKKTAIKPVGSIFKVKDDKVMISAGDLVYIREESGVPLIKGDKYMIYRTIYPVIDKSTNSYIGVQHLIIGQVKILKNEQGFVLANVLKSFRMIKKNDYIMPCEKKISFIKLKKSKKGLDGKIILSEEHQIMFGSATIAFINKGNQDDVATGQQYSIYRQEKGMIKLSGPKVILPPDEIGTLLVLRTEAKTSTVLITKSERDIEINTRICYPLEK